jgi:signal transduction histidine kinase
LSDLAHEQAALRRVATLAARESSPVEVFGAVTKEAARVLETEAVGMLRFDPDGFATLVAQSQTPWDPPPLGTRFALDGENIVTSVHRTGQAARMDDWERATGAVAAMAHVLGVRSAVATPIIVDKRLWGTIIAATSAAKPLPAQTESRIGEFIELVATAIANAESREALTRLADEQAALRRVATLVARETSEPEVLAAIAREIGQLFGTGDIRMVRYEADSYAVVVAGTGARPELFPVGLRIPLGGDNATSLVFRTGRPARIDDYRQASGPIADAVRPGGVRSIVGAPIVVGGRLWGAMIVVMLGDEILPPDTESRLEQFTELIATAIANAEARAEVERLADEQAALRRVATLVAEGASAAAVFDAVTAEMERLLDADGVILSRYEPDDEMTIVAHSGAGVEIGATGTRVSLSGENVVGKVRRTREAARMEDYTESPGTVAQLIRDIGVHSAVGAPIVVAGQLWGVTVTLWRREHGPPDDTEERMVQFAELLGTAIANADSRDQLSASRARLVTEADRARRRVVRDLHDGAQQRLVHAIVTLKLAQRAVNQGDETAETLVVEALQHAERGNAELRELAHGILPAALTNGGLRAGVDALVGRLDLPVRADLPAARLPTDIEASVYFMVAEALTNMMKHSHASHAEVTAAVEDGVVQVDVRDDGIGGADPDGRGLVGMADRVSALGGQLTIDSPAGCGTHVSARFPLSGAGRGPAAPTQAGERRTPRR